MKNRTCCFTGHRKIPSGEYQRIAERLREEIIRLINLGVIYFGAGGALGFDTIAAQTILELKKEYPLIRLILVLPCPEQTNGWSEKNILIYEDIKAKCDKYAYASKEYTHECMYRRNRHLVDNSDYCIYYLTDSKGGTAYTVEYAGKKGLQIFNIAKDGV